MTAGPFPVGLTVTDPTTVVHAVADLLVGQWVELAWGTFDGVWRGPAVILGCSHVDGEDSGTEVAVGLPTETGIDIASGMTYEDHRIIHVSVGWDELLRIGPDIDFHPPCLLGQTLVDRIATASRWFGHQMTIIQRDGTSVTGPVAGFDVSLYDDDVLVAVLQPPDPNHPDEDCDVALVTFEEIDSVVDLNT